MKKALLRIVRNDILLLLGGSILGLTALLLVFLLPLGPMQTHVYWSLGMIEKEFTDEVLVDGYPSTMTGNFTDCLMLEHAVYRSENHGLLEQVLHMYRGESCEEGGWWPGQSLRDYLEGVSQPREASYARYWHGYLVILKPLLLLTSVNTLRLLNSAIQLLLIGCVIVGLCRRDASQLAMGFLLSLPFLFWVSTYASLSLSICFYIMVLSLLIQLKWDSRLASKGLYGEFFLTIGMATSYFDFLTYPLVTLVFPLTLSLYLHGGDLGRRMRAVLGYSAQWFVGYMGLWASKWVLTDLLTGSSAIRDALNTLHTRTYCAEGHSRIDGFVSVIGKNIQPYGNWCFIGLVVIGLALLLRGVVRKEIKGRKPVEFIPFILLALYPLIWFFVTQNHSEQHWQFTCRIFACSVFAVYAACAERRSMPQ